MLRLTQAPFDVAELHRHKDTPAGASRTSARAGTKRTSDEPNQQRMEEAKQARLRLAAAARAKMAGGRGKPDGLRGAAAQGAPESAAAAPADAPTASEPPAPRPAPAPASTTPPAARPTPRPRSGVKPEPKETDPAATTPDDAPWDSEMNDAEAASMALELELEDDLLLRQSQLAQELDNDDLDTDTQ